MTDTADSLWFMTAQILIHLAQSDNDGRLSIIEHRMARDFAPPLHVHHQESETFVVLEGRFRFQRDGEVLEADVGDTVHLPRGCTHGFRVLSDYGRCLTITDGPFEDMVRAASRPAATNCPNNCRRHQNSSRRLQPSAPLMPSISSAHRSPDDTKRNAARPLGGVVRGVV